MCSDDIEWLKELPYTISVPSRGIIVVHAGLVPGVPLNAQHPYELLTMRNVRSLIPTEHNDCENVSVTNADNLKRATIATSDTATHNNGAKVQSTVATWQATSSHKDGLPWAEVWSQQPAEYASLYSPSLPSPPSSGVGAETAISDQFQVIPHVYFGHDAKRRLQRYEHATGLDSGCVYGKCSIE